MNVRACVSQLHLHLHSSEPLAASPGHVTQIPPATFTCQGSMQVVFLLSALGLLVHSVNTHWTQAMWKKPRNSDVKMECQEIKQKKFPVARHARGYTRLWVALKSFECMGSHSYLERPFLCGQQRSGEGRWLQTRWSLGEDWGAGLQSLIQTEAWIWATESRVDSLDREHGREAWLMGLSTRWKWRDCSCKREWEVK